jgi:hypothetical protein
MIKWFITKAVVAAVAIVLPAAAHATHRKNNTGKKQKSVEEVIQVQTKTSKL